MLERLNDQAANAVVLAEEEARKLGHHFVGTELLLLGLIAEGTSAAGRTLASFGLHLKNCRAAVKNFIGAWDEDDFVANHIPYTPRVQRAFEQARAVADVWGAEQIGCEHLLLGLLRQDNSAGANRIICGFGLEPDVVQARLMQVINGDDFPPLSEPPIPNDIRSDEDDDVGFRSYSREDALANIFGFDSFVRADSAPDGMLEWLNKDKDVFGVYMNSADNYLVICEDRIHWYNGDVRTQIDYKRIESVALPESEEEPYLKLNLRPSNEVLMLPVLNATEGVADFSDMYEFLLYSIRVPEPTIAIHDVQSLADFVAFLRQPGISNVGFANLTSSLERGLLNETWLESLEIERDALDDPNVWKLMAAVLLRHPECAI